MLLTTSYSFLFLFSVAHRIFLWVIIELFEVRPPIIVIVFYVSIRSSEVVNHIHPKIVTLMSCTQVLETLVDRRRSLG